MEFIQGKLYTNASDSLSMRPMLRHEVNGGLGHHLDDNVLFGEMPVGTITLLCLGERLFQGVQEGKTYRSFSDWILFYKFLFQDKVVYLEKNYAFVLKEKVVE